MIDPERRAELEQQAVGSGWLMLVLACVFLYADAAGWAIFCSLVGLGWLASSARE